MKNHKRFWNIIFSISILFGMNGCKKDEQVVSPPLPGNELITTVKLQFISSDQADTIQAVWRDLTPNDINPPDTSAAVISLRANKSYQAEIAFWDETKSPAVDLTPEIKQRGNYHRIFYFSSSLLGNNLVFIINDFDTNSPPLALGISSTCTTHDVSSGFLNVILKHQPNVKDGTFAPGSIDLDVNFQVSIQP